MSADLFSFAVVQYCQPEGGNVLLVELHVCIDLGNKNGITYSQLQQYHVLIF